MCVCVCIRCDMPLSWAQRNEMDRAYQDAQKRLSPESEDLRTVIACLEKKLTSDSSEKKHLEKTKTKASAGFEEELVQARHKLKACENTLEDLRLASVKLEHDQTSIAAEAIRIELVTERARQLLKLHSLVSAMPDAPPKQAETSPCVSAHTRQFLAESLALEPAAVNALCENVVGLCDFSVADRLEPLVATLQASVDEPPKRLGQMISRWPGVLALSHTDVLDVMAFLEQEALLPIKRYGAIVSVFVHAAWKIGLLNSHERLT
jgi:hypothetical protein